MKMVKKILLGTLALAAVLALTSCGKREEEGSLAEVIKVNAGSKKASIDFSNDGDFARGFKTLQTLHLDAVCHITNSINTIENPNDDLKTNGVMGYIFNLVKNEETNKYSFTIAGVRYNQKTKKAEAYVETFKDVAGDKLESELPTGIHANGTLWDNSTINWGEKAFGFVLGEPTITDNKIDIWIDVVANDGNTVGRKGTAGTYTVRFFDKDPKRKVSGDEITYEAENVSPIATLTVAESEVNNKFVKEDGKAGALKNMQSDIGFYANVQKGQRLVGEWKFESIKMEAEEIEE